MRLSPVFQRAVSFALAGGELGADLVERHNLNLGESDNEGWSIEVVYDNLYFADARDRFGVCFVRPEERCSAALVTASNLGEKFYGQCGRIAECSHPRDTDGKFDAMAPQLRSEVFDFRQWFHVGQAV